MNEVCARCGRPVTADEKSLHIKLAGRNKAGFLCLSCMAAYYRVTEDKLRELIDYYRSLGCVLF